MASGWLLGRFYIVDRHAKFVSLPPVLARSEANYCLKACDNLVIQDQKSLNLAPGGGMV